MIANSLSRVNCFMISVMVDNGRGTDEPLSAHYFAGGVAAGALVAAALAAFTRSQIAFWTSLVGGGAQPSSQA